MRKIALLATMAFLTPALVLHAQESNEKVKIKGSGNVITKDITIQSFDELSVSGVFNVVLSQGNTEDLKIEAEDNLQEFFEVKNEGNKLVVKMKKDLNLDKHKQMKVFITFKKLKSLDLKTVGDVSCSGTLSFETLKLDNKSVGSVDLKFSAVSLEMENKSVGNIKLNGKADNAKIKNHSVGEFQAASFIVQKMDIDNNGIGNAEVNAEKELKVKDSMMGKVTNKGAAPTRKMNKVVI